jgi:hypothetical protein
MTMPNSQYNQTYPNSCGASAFLCAILELGTTQLPANPAYPLWTFPKPLVADRSCELAIYAVTNGSGGLPPQATDGYSLPSYIHDCAVAVGRTAVGYVPSNLVGSLLCSLYQGDVERATARGMTINRARAPRPGQHQRLLRVMRVGEDSFYKPATGLHYIMERPDGSVMDPALGLDANNLAALAEHHRLEGVSYIDTGIGIVIG